MTVRIRVTSIAFRTVPSFFAFGSGRPVGPPRTCPGGSVRLATGPDDADAQTATFAALADRAAAELTMTTTLDGDAVLEITETATSGSALRILVPTNQPSFPHEADYEATTSDALAIYTLRVRIEGLAPDHGVRLGPDSTSQCLVSPDGEAWSCFVPTENALVFAPQYNRKQLVCDDARGHAQTISDPEIRRQYVAAMNRFATANPGVSSPWLGEVVVAGRSQRRVGFEIAGTRYWVREPADATGAFQSGLREFSRYWSVPRAQQFIIDNGFAPELALGHGHDGEGDHLSVDDKRTQVLAHLDAHRESIRSGDADAAGAVVFFCHGYRTGFQLALQGIRPPRAASDTGFRDLVTAIKGVSRPDVVVALYACATASPPNDGTNFAALLRDALISGDDPKPQCRVVGHQQVAHAFWTSDLMFFEGSDGVGALGHEVMPSDHPGAAFFARSLGNGSPRPGLRWAFPFMSIESIRAFCTMASPPDEAYQLP